MSDPANPTENRSANDATTDASAPMVSVIVPVYRSERYVVETLRSALRQTHRDLEVVVVDDGSPDASIALCKEIDDGRVRFLHQANTGLSAARNAGIRQARGRYIAFLDSDDRWAPDKLERHLQHLESQPDLGMSYGYSSLIDEKGRALGLYQMMGRSDTTAIQCFECNPVGNGSNAVLRREVFADLGSGFDETLPQAEDFELWVRLAHRTDWKIACIPYPLTEYRIHPDSLSADVDRQRRFHMQAISKIEEYAPELVEERRRAAEANLNWYLARHLLLRYRLADATASIARALRLAPRVVRIHNLLLTGSLIAAAVLPQRVHAHATRVAERLYGRFQASRIRRRQQRSRPSLSPQASR